MQCSILFKKLDFHFLLMEWNIPINIIIRNCITECSQPVLYNTYSKALTLFVFLDRGHMNDTWHWTETQRSHSVCDMKVCLPQCWQIWQTGKQNMLKKLLIAISQKRILNITLHLRLIKNSVLRKNPDFTVFKCLASEKTKSNWRVFF